MKAFVLILCVALAGCVVNPPGAGRNFGATNDPLPHVPDLNQDTREACNASR